MSFVAVLPQLVRGNGVPTVATRSTLIIYVSLNVRILDHPRDSLVAMQVDIGHKASNRHAKTGFLFCSWQIGKYFEKPHLLLLISDLHIPQRSFHKRSNATTFQAPLNAMPRCTGHLGCCDNPEKNRTFIFGLRRCFSN